MKKLSLFAVLLIIVSCLASCGNDAASIGIIGGADGPTAIFVTSNTNWLNICTFLGAPLLIIIVAIIYHNKK